MKGAKAMRLVSYDRHIDCLYDAVIIWTRHTYNSYKIMASPVNGNPDEEYTMGYYSSEENMESELTRLHKSYDMMSISVFQFKKDKEVEA